jgi:hypothetical protein
MHSGLVLDAEARQRAMGLNDVHSYFTRRPRDRY